MKRNKAVVDIAGGTIAMLIAIVFVRTYSVYVDLRIELEVGGRGVAKVCEMLRDWSLGALFLPLVVVALGSIMVVAKKEAGVAIVCQSAWLLALAIICFTLVAWQVSFIPIPGPLTKTDAGCRRK